MRIEGMLGSVPSNGAWSLSCRVRVIVHSRNAFRTVPRMVALSRNTTSRRLWSCAGTAPTAVNRARRAFRAEVVRVKGSTGSSDASSRRNGQALSLQQKQG